MMNNKEHNSLLLSHLVYTETKMVEKAWDYVWSIDDGKGAVSTTARHLIYGPDTDVKPEVWMAIWMSPVFVATMLPVYLVGKGLAFVLAHNLLLCVFSAAIAYKNWTITAYTMKQVGIVSTYCTNALWENITNW